MTKKNPNELKVNINRIIMNIIIVGILSNYLLKHLLIQNYTTDKIYQTDRQ